MPQLISAIEIYKLSIPLKQPFVISLGPQYDADNLIVKITTEDGITGWGECSPYMSINGESMDTCFIVGQYLAKALKGKDALDIEGCTKAIDSIITRNENIKSAFDMALYDIAAQHAQQPLYRVLGGTKNKVISTDMTVGLGSLDKMAKEALEYKEAGFPSIKVKLGTSTEEDVNRIKAVRTAIGNEHPLRIDANQGWSVEAAIATLQALGDYNIEFANSPAFTLFHFWKTDSDSSLKNFALLKQFAERNKNKLLVFGFPYEYKQNVAAAKELILKYKLNWLQLLQYRQANTAGANVIDVLVITEFPTYLLLNREGFIIVRSHFLGDVESLLEQSK